MSNVWLVIKREYITRVRRRSFILATLLTPLGLVLFAVVINLLVSYENDDEQRIAVIDEGDLFNGTIPDQNGLYFKFVDETLEELRAQSMAEEGGDAGLADYSAVLVIPEVKDPRRQDFRVQYYSDETLTLDAEFTIKNRIEKALREYKIEALELDKRTLASLDSDVKLRSSSFQEEDGEAEDRSYTSVIGAGLGGFMGFIMYLSVFIYGMMVMRSVMEEKTNRIVEVIISSVKPFTLLLGKIVGVGALGLTQVLVWMIMIPGLLFLAGIFFGFDAEPPPVSGTPEIDPEEMQSVVERVVDGVFTLNWWLIIPCFILYFIGGYLTYAALFAAVGSAIGDDTGESQSLTLPITIPVILAFYIMTAALQAPNSSLAVWSSMFPLFAPIVMPARLAFDPPLWQVLLSLILVFAFAAAMVWMAARIYRIGILNYGKKSSLREMSKWIRSK